MPAWSYPVMTGADGCPVVLGVRDGDTIRLLLDAGCETGLWPWLRLDGVNCPELRDPGGAEAAAFTRHTLAAATRIRATLSGRSFARWVAVVSCDGVDLSQMVIDAGHGTAYNP